jgi:hypothetical protein
MSYSTIRRIREALARHGLAHAVALAQSYGMREPADFVLYVLAKPGQCVRMRNA